MLSIIRLSGNAVNFFTLLISRNARSNSKRSGAGFSLVEVIISILILGVIITGIIAFLQSASLMIVSAQERTRASKLAQKIFSVLGNIHYHYIFRCDSSISEFGLAGDFGPVTNQTSPYPYLKNLQELQQTAEDYRFDKFTIETKFMIRDLSDLDGDGETTDLRAFIDTNNDGADDYDSGIKYLDQNNDGDYYDFFGSPDVSEEPDTHIKKVTIKIYKNNEKIFQEIQLISLEKFSGIQSRASGAELKLVLNEPKVNSSLYALDTLEQQTSPNLIVTFSYPAGVKAYRADSSDILRLSGITDPVAQTDWRLISATSPILDTTYADMLGNFDFYAFNITFNLVEGDNEIWGQATKDSSYSPWDKTNVIRDINPPVIQNITPTGTVTSKQPLVGGEIVDNPVTAGNSVSGICPDVITLLKDGIPVNHDYDSSSGMVRCLDSLSGLPPILSTGIVYTMVLEGGDNAYYKVKTTWTFICQIADPDDSIPSISQKDPVGTALSNPPTISCKVSDNQSGIIINSIRMTLNGDVVVSSANISQCFTPFPNPDGGYVSYTPPSPLTGGIHNVEVNVSHWADNPYDKRTSAGTWSFHVP
jgi:type II secretory pathway pseudopilin PulG